MAYKKVVSREYRALMCSVQRQARAAVSTTIVPCHKCADCDNMVILPRVYCKCCEMKACTTSGCGGSRNPRGMLIHYGYEVLE